MVRKILYGLKQTAFEWNKKCDKILNSLGLILIPVEPRIYIRTSDGLIVGVYIDDLLILAPRGKQQLIEDFKSALRKQLRIKELGPVKRILGMQVTCERLIRTVNIDR